jgi:hypothetical protein
MGYTGSTYVLPCDRGGFTGQKNIDTADPVSMVGNTVNLNMHQGARQKRGGTSHVNAAAFTSTPQVMGLYDFRLVNGNQFIMAGTKDGKVYKDDTNTIKTGMSTSNNYNFVTFENEAFICDGATRPQTWDGAAGATSDITSIPGDWTGSNFPQWMVKHGYGVSERLWAFGCPTTPQTVYASQEGDGKDFSDANVTTLSIETGDGFGIVGSIEYGDRLFVFGKTKAYIIDDTDASTANWGYQDVQWNGGVANWRLLVKTPNDLVAMMEDGDIYSVSAAETYGDYKAASLARPGFIHEWIQNNVNLAQIANFHAVYDPSLRAIKFFMASAGATNNDMAMVYFIDRPPEEAWMVHKNATYSSGYDASCSALVRVGAGDWQVYTGDYSGETWKLETVNIHDENSAYDGRFKTPVLSFENERGDKNFARAWLVLQPETVASTLTLDWFVDGVQQTQRTVTVQNSGGKLGSFTLGTSLLGGDEVIEKPVDLRQNGRRLQLEIGTSTVNEDFFISQVLIDYRPLGLNAGA